ncbi:Exocyst complex component S5 [Batrachochytrium dendrobatidis]
MFTKTSMSDVSSKVSGISPSSSILQNKNGNSKLTNFGSKLKQQVIQPKAIETSDSEYEDKSDDEDSTDGTWQPTKGSTDDLHKSSGLSAGDTSKWNAEEQAAVLNFYGLDTLFPRKWVNDPSLALVTTPMSSNASNPLALGSESPTKLVQTQRVTPDGRLDTSDPLGIKETILRRGKRRESTAFQPGVPSIFISEKSFDPNLFLKEVHRLTLYKEFEQGAVHLKMSIEQRNEIIKGLVKKHFAKFVSAKGTIDTFYREMCQKNLVSSSNYGIAPFAKALEELESNANNLYGPVLGRRSNGDKIRITLGILEGWKFFFNLPSSLIDQINKDKYDGAVRDYKKGKYLMHSSFSDVVQPGKDFRGTKDSSALLPKTHQAVFEKVWNEVERIVGQFRTELFAKLGDSSNSVDAQEKLISYLVDLDSEKSPIMCFLERQYLWLVDKIKDCHKTYISKLYGVRQAFPSRCNVGQNYDTLTSFLNQDTQNESDDKVAEHKSNNEGSSMGINTNNQKAPIAFRRSTDYLSLYDLKQGLSQSIFHNFELLFSNNDDAQAWKLTLRFIQEVCSLLCSRLPDFCRICKLYIDGKLSKTKANDSNRKATQASRIQMVDKIFKSITDLIAAILEDTFGLKMSFSELILMLETQDMSKGNFQDNDTPQDTPPINIQGISIDTLNTDTKRGSESNANKFDAVFEECLIHLEPLAVSHHPSRFAHLISHPLIATHYSTKIVSVLSQMYSEIRHLLFIREDAAISGLSIALTQSQNRLVECICEGFQTTSAQFYMYEDWSYEANSAMSTRSTESVLSDSTSMVKLFYRLSKFLVRTLGYIHSALFYPSTTETLGTVTNTSQLSKESRGYTAITTSRQSMVDKIKFACFESQYLFLDGLQCLATQQSIDNSSFVRLDEQYSVIHPQWVSGNFGTRLPFSSKNADSRWTNKKNRKLIMHSIETRSFVILGNLAFIKTVFIPKMSNMLEQKLRTLVRTEVKSLCDTVDYLDSLLVKNYVRRQMITIKPLLESGILSSGLDWQTLAKTQDVRSYCHQVLLHLVLVHAAISEVSKSHVQRIMSEMLLSLSNCILMAYRSVDSFSTSGMLQATLETEFFHHTLKAYDTPETISVMGMIYDTVERSTVRADQSQTLLNDALLRVKGYLQQSKKSTEVQFACFRDGTNAERDD